MLKYYMESAETSITKTTIKEILEKSDLTFRGTGMKPSEAWQYRETVRTKYDLPECGYRWDDPVRYIQTIEDFLKKEGIEIREKHEFKQFFKDNPGAAALSSGPNVFRNNTVIVGSNNPDGEYWKLRARANQLAHEAVHAIQKKNILVCLMKRLKEKRTSIRSFTQRIY